MSDLGRLLWRRAGEHNTPLENFTTEALAIAISHDFRPMKEALRQVEWFHTAEVEQTEPFDIDAIVAISAETQKALWTNNGVVGYLDLVLTAYLRDGQRREIWIEVKVNALVSGQQLGVYLEQATLVSPPTRVITLARTRISDEVPTLKWNSIAKAVDTTHDVHSSWAALSEFLSEEHIASPPTPPPEDTAACIEVLVEVNRIIQRLWPTKPRISWSDNGLRKVMKAANPSDLMASAGPLWFGLKYKDHRWRWNLIVATVKNYERIPMDPNEVLHAADFGELADQWVRHPESREVLQLVAVIDDEKFADRDEIVSWFDQGLLQLHAAGILDSFTTGLRRKHKSAT